MTKVSLYRREGSKKWWLRYRDKTGNLCRRSAGTTDESRAREIADSLELEMEWEQTIGTPLLDSETDGAEGIPPAPSTPPWDGFEERAERLHAMMVGVAKENARSQVRIASQISSGIRELALRIRHLERIIERSSEGT